MAAMQPEVVFAGAVEVVADLGRFVAVAADEAWHTLPVTLPPPVQRVSSHSLEDLDLERLAGQTHDEVATIVGIGGGVALDTAKYLAARGGCDLLLVPTTLGTLAPFTYGVARRVRRQVFTTPDEPVGPDRSWRVVVDLDLIGAAPAERNRAGAAAVAATAPAEWDWRLGDSRGRGVPVSSRLTDAATALRARLADAAEDIAGGSTEGLGALARLLIDLGALVNSGSRLIVDGSAATFVQAYEHRLAGLPRPGGYGGLLGLAAVGMSALQSWYGVAAGGDARPEEVVALLSRCQVVANPHQLGLDEGTFRGLLRHAVRFQVGEFLPWTVLNEADVNATTAEELWRQVWQVPRVRP
jgi:glycerol dehydrogenase-like iron-containing ADH family enzyme